MQNNQNTSIEHIIAKLDNDFNFDNSDWIPRVAAWTIEALSILRCVKTEIKKVEIATDNRIVHLGDIPINKIKVYTKCGCELENLEDLVKSRCVCSPVGRDEQIAIPIDPTQYPTEYVTTSRLKAPKDYRRYYVKASNNSIELNFETDKVIIEYKAPVTYMSEIYGCELPVIPNNGLLIEAIAYYCVYKILCRGYKHPVMNLGASQYGTNPFFMWNHLKDEAKRSVIINEQGEVIDDGGQWRNSFFNFTFNPRD